MKENPHRPWSIVVVALAAMSLVACDSGPAAPELTGTEAVPDAQLSSKGGQKGKKPKDDTPSDPDPEPTPDYAWYQIEIADDSDPLYRFGRDGDLVLLESDPTVTSWGTDYWGYWAEPFTAVPDDSGFTVEYTNGLATTTYRFSALSDGRFDVGKTVVMQPYLGGDPSTTVTHVGVFAPEL